ncbi:MAG: tripartite tricarboxylate transporter substrate binding protein [Xanthobacteraceae bacterium]|nr:tripartite tricarboxylate transporter substrate binding protein [Xanthobacteraceae bacterium]
MKIPRRRLLGLAAGGAALMAMPRSGVAQSYPTRPITLVVFVGAGGAPDIVARIVATPLSQRLGQPVVIDNRPGAGGNIALQAVARAPADGYTLLLVATPHAVNVTLYEKQEVNLLRDIVPVASIDDDAFALLVTKSLPVNTVPELIAYAKANPGKINITSSGTGNLSHLAGELFRMMTGTRMVHVPYRGMPAANTALITGEAHVMFNALPSALPHVKEGTIRAIGVTTKTRAKMLPDVPAIAESLPDYNVTGWLGIGAPKDTPPEVVDRLNREMNAVLRDPEVLTRLAHAGSEPFSGSPGDFGKFLAAETEKWSKVVRFAGLKVE